MDPTKKNSITFCANLGKGATEHELPIRKYKLAETEKGESCRVRSRGRFAIKGIVHKEFVLAEQTVNSAYYFDGLWRLCEYVRRLRPELW
jgi:hypothetical protein